MYTAGAPSSRRLVQAATGRRGAARAALGLRRFNGCAALHDRPSSAPPPKGSGSAGDFKGQLYESTQRRLERERESQRRLAQGQQQSPGFRNLATTLSLVLTALGCYYLGRWNASSDAPGEASTLPLAATPRLEHDTSPSNMQAAWAEFVELLGAGHVSTDEQDVDAHAGSEWSTYYRQAAERPFVVVYPGTTEEVAAVMRVCHRRRIPVVGFSGGTSLEGHFAATHGGVCVDFRRMDRVLALHAADMDVVVQPAVGWQALNEELAEAGLFFPPDPGPGAMIGGMVGTGCSGTNAYRYGTMKEWVLALTVVLADGTVVRTKQRPRKSSAGYDLTRLFVGSEGTLGLVTEATLRLAPRPRHESVAVAAFPSVRDAAACVARCVAAGLELAGLEFIDDVQMACINRSNATSRKWREASTLFLKFAGASETAVREQVAAVRAIAADSHGQSFEFARDPAEARELWSARKQILWSMLAMKRDPADKIWTTDVAVPISRLPEIIEQTKQDLESCGLLAGICGHVGDGNFHTIIVANDKQRELAEGVVHRMVKRAVELEGTVTGEHGVGMIKRDYLPHEHGQAAVDAMRRLKQALDPLFLLNPGKVFRIEPPRPGEVHEW